MARPDFTKKWASSRPSIPEIASPDYAQGFANYLGAIPPSTDDHDYIMNLQDERAVWLDENKAPLASPAFIGAPTAPTAPQFDNDTSLATTEFVQRALGNFQTAVILTENTTLTAADAGKGYNFSGIGVACTITLPLVSGLPFGSTFSFKNNSVYTQTISGQGADLLAWGQISITATFALPPGASVIFTKQSTGGYLVVGGTADLAKHAEFVASLAANGYQKLPSGLIIQWGSLSVAATSSSPVTWPVAFPTAAIQALVSMGESVGSGGTCGIYSLSMTGANISNAESSSNLIRFFAIGY